MDNFEQEFLEEGDRLKWEGGEDRNGTKVSK